MKNRSRISFKKSDYIKTVTRPYPPLWSSLMLVGSADKNFYKDFLAKPYDEKNTVDCDYAWYYEIKRQAYASRLIAKEWFNEKNFMRVVKMFEKREKELIAAVNRDLFDLAFSFKAYMPAMRLIHIAEGPLLDEVRKLLLKKTSLEKTDQLLDCLNLPLKNNFYKQEEYDLVKTKNLKAHVKKYIWINSRYGRSAPYTIEEARIRLSQIDKNGFLFKYKKEKSDLRKVIAEAKNILGRENRYLIDLFQFIIFYRTHRTDIINKTIFLYIPKLKKIAATKKLTYEQILFFTIDELLGKTDIGEDVIGERMKGHAMVIDNGVPKCLIGAEYEIIKEIFREYLNDVTEIKGSIASKGLVKGRVKIILNKNDFSKLDEGDILVSSMTTPDMISVMKKAAAFITDEGGITSHAAIISREMRKPCIIGTKISTQVLRDGDLVEVDANKGVVKIIEKHYDKKE